MTAFRQDQFLDVIDRDEADRRFRAALSPRPLEPETVPLAEAHGRVLAVDVPAPIDVPGFDRSNVDGFAVRAEDTFGAAEDRPVSLTLNDETVPPGVQPRVTVAAGTATAIATGGMLPRGADAVVMVEHTDVRDGRLVLSRAAAPGANVSFAGTDIGRGEVVLRRGEVLTAREVGVLAALGVAAVPVTRRPRVAILSTGDELVPPGKPLAPGQVYDSNATVLAAAVRELGCEPVPLGIVPDELSALRSGLREALACDAVLLSGGTSKGAGDVSYRAVGELGPPGIVAHGVALKPGKPLCLAVVNRPGEPGVSTPGWGRDPGVDTPGSPVKQRRIPVAVLPGFPTSAIFTFHEFLAPVLRTMAGRFDRPAGTVEARLPVRVNSERGRTEFLLVGLVQQPDGAPGPPWAAYPMGKGSGSVTAFGRADGFVVIPRQREYLERDEVAAVQLLAADLRPADLVVIGSHCTGLDYLVGELHGRGFTCKVLAVGSAGGLEAAKRGECDVAGVHLLDPVTDTYNRPFLPDGVELLPGYGRMQGVVFRPGDRRFEGRTIGGAVAAALADPECVLVNRNRGSGTRVLIDRLLGGAKPPGHLTEVKSHTAVAAAVAQGRADWGLAILSAGAAAGLGFIPLREEQYDFLIPAARRHRPAVKAFAGLLREPGVRSALTTLGLRT